MRSVGCVGPLLLSLHSTLFFLPLKPNIDNVEGPGKPTSVWTPCWSIRQKFWLFSCTKKSSVGSSLGSGSKEHYLRSLAALKMPTFASEFNTLTLETASFFPKTSLKWL